jgi:hypothetical protein
MIDGGTSDWHHDTPPSRYMSNLLTAYLSQTRVRTCMVSIQNEDVIHSRTKIDTSSSFFFLVFWRLVGTAMRPNVLTVDVLDGAVRSMFRKQLILWACDDVGCATPSLESCSFSILAFSSTVCFSSNDSEAHLVSRNCFETLEVKSPMPIFFQYYSI